MANLHPAVLEAYHSGTALLLLTADRPTELQDSGASQTIDQRGIFGHAAISVDFPIAFGDKRENAIWRALVCRAVVRAVYDRPVQINIPFREPLLSLTLEGDEPAFEGRESGKAWTSYEKRPMERPKGSRKLPLPARTVMILGGGQTERARAAAETAAFAGWPVIAEPAMEAVALSAGATVIQSGALIAGGGELPTGLASPPSRLLPEAIVVVGRPTLSLGILSSDSHVPVYSIDKAGRWSDPHHVAHGASTWLDKSDIARIPIAPEWLEDWNTFDKAVADSLTEFLANEPWPTGLHLARNLVEALPQNSTLLVGASNAIRDIHFAAAPRPDVDIYSNRGVAGIDGNISTAIGLALANRKRPTYALMGDLTFLHDANGLLIGPDEPQPNLTIVVLNDRGGGNFSLFENGAAQEIPGFERVFGTPHRTNIEDLCGSHQITCRKVHSSEEFHNAIRQPSGISVVEVVADRGRLHALHSRLKETLIKTAASVDFSPA